MLNVFSVNAPTLLVLLCVATPASAKNLKVYISVDMEGLTGVTNHEQTSAGGKDYATGREWLAAETNAAILGALDAGASEIVVNDAHGSNSNLLASDLHPAASLISGSPKPLGMMQGIDGSFSAVIFIGYHARAGTTDAVMDHTNSTSTVRSVKINNVEMPELGLNALTAGHFGVPVVFVSGDGATARQTQELLGGKVVTLAVKEAIGRQAAKHLPLKTARQRIREGVKEAVARRKQIPPYKLKAPYRVELTFQETGQTDVAMLLPRLERLDARTVAFVENDYLLANRLYRALLYLGASAE